MKDFFELREFLGHRIPAAGADSAGVRKATGADNRAPNYGKPRQKDDNKIQRMKNEIDRLQTKMEEMQKRAEKAEENAEKAMDRGDNRAHEKFAAEAERAEELLQKAYDEQEALSDKLKKAKAEFNKKNEEVNEILGFGKKKKEEPRDQYGRKMKNDGSNDPHQVLTAKIDKLEAKLKATRKKWTDAQDKGDEEAEDYWGGVEMNQTQELEKLKDELKKMRAEK